MKYSEQVKQLQTLGELQEPLPNYLSLGFTAGHADELIQMATDTELLNLDESDPLFWGAIPCSGGLSMRGMCLVSYRSPKR